MADLSKLSDQDLQAIANGDLKSVSDDGLQLLAAPPSVLPQVGSALESAKMVLTPSAAAAEYLSAHPKESQAALEHFGNAAALGYLPQLQAAAEPAMTKALDLITGKNISENLPDYVTRRDENLSRLKDEQAQSPKASLAGTAAGTIAGGAATSALAPVKAATLPGRIAQAAAEGAALMGAANPGDTQGEISPLQLEMRARNAEMGAALGSAVQGAGELIGAAGGAASNAAKNFAEKKAFKALGPLKRDAINNADDINAIGRAALDSGVIRAIPTGAQGLSERAADAAESKGQEIGSIVDELKGLPDQPSPIDKKAIADNLRQQLLGNSKIPGVANRNAQFNDLIDQFENSNDPMDLNTVRALKVELGGGSGKNGLINWNRMKGADVPLEEQFHRALYSQLANAEDEIANAVEQGNYGQSSTRFQNAKDTYGALKTAQAIAGKKAAADTANRMLGLTDTIAGGAGADAGAMIAGRPGAYVGGAIGALGNKLGRTYGNQVMASGSDALSQILAKSPALAQAVSNNPALAPEILSIFSRQNSTPQAEDYPDYINRVPAKGSETAVSRRLKNKR